jgi:hypothetical protein
MLGRFRLEAARGQTLPRFAVGVGLAIAATAACQASLELDAYSFSRAGGAGDEGQGGSHAVPPGPVADAGGVGAGGAGAVPAVMADASVAGGPELGCLPCELAHAEAACVDAGCVIASCRGPWRDANGNVDDGCEAGDVPSDQLTLWFMADQGVTTAADGSVTTWIDQSPGNRSASQPVLAQRPTLVSAPPGQLPMLSFDGTNDFLDLPPGFSTFTGASFFAVVEALPNDLCAGILHFSNGSDADDVEFGRHQPNLLYYEVVGSFLNGTPRGFVVDRRLVLSVVQAGSSDGVGSVESRIDGSLDQIGPVDLPRVVERLQNYVGRNGYFEQPELCSMYFRGRIGELLFYPRGVTGDERQQIESYLAEKWQAR